MVESTYAVNFQSSDFQSNQSQNTDTPIFKSHLREFLQIWNTKTATENTKEVLIKSTSPSPLMGEGWGEGEKLSTYPSPQPSPSGGEGVNQHFPKGVG